MNKRGAYNIYIKQNRYKILNTNNIRISGNEFKRGGISHTYKKKRSKLIHTDHVRVSGNELKRGGWEGVLFTLQDRLPNGNRDALSFNFNHTEWESVDSVPSLSHRATKGHKFRMSKHMQSHAQQYCADPLAQIV